MKLGIRHSRTNVVYEIGVRNLKSSAYFFYLIKQKLNVLLKIKCLFFALSSLFLRKNWPEYERGKKFSEFSRDTVASNGEWNSNHSNNSKSRNIASLQS